MIIILQTNQLYYNPQLSTYYTFNTELGQYELYCAAEFPAGSTEEDNDQDPSNYTIESNETMSLKSRVVHESKMYLEIVQELGQLVQG